LQLAYQGVEKARYQLICKDNPQFKALYANKKHTEVIPSLTLKQVIQSLCTYGKGSPSLFKELYKLRNFRSFQFSPIHPEPIPALMQDFAEFTPTDTRQFQRECPLQHKFKVDFVAAVSHTNQRQLYDEEVSTYFLSPGRILVHTFLRASNNDNKMGNSENFSIEMLYQYKQMQTFAQTNSIKDFSVRMSLSYRVNIRQDINKDDTERLIEDWIKATIENCVNKVYAKKLQVAMKKSIATFTVRPETDHER